MTNTIYNENDNYNNKIQETNAGEGAETNPETEGTGNNGENLKDIPAPDKVSGMVECVKSDVKDPAKPRPSASLNDLPAARGFNMVECVKNYSGMLEGGIEWMPNAAVMAPSEEDTFFHQLARIIPNDSAALAVPYFEQGRFVTQGNKKVGNLLTPTEHRRNMHIIRLEVEMGPDYVNYNVSNVDLNSIAENAVRECFAEEVYKLLIRDGIDNSVDAIGTIEPEGKVERIARNDLSTDVVHDTLRIMESKLKDKHLKNAVWLTSAETYTKIINVTNENGDYIEKAESVNGMPMLRGRPVYRHELFNEVPNVLILADLKEGLIIAESPDLRKVADRNASYPNIVNKISKHIASIVVEKAFCVLRLEDEARVEAANAEGQAGPAEQGEQ